MREQLAKNSIFLGNPLPILPISSFQRINKAADDSFKLKTQIFQLRTLNHSKIPLKIQSFKTIMRKNPTLFDLFAIKTSNRDDLFAQAENLLQKIQCILRFVSHDRHKQTTIYYRDI